MRTPVLLEEGRKVGYIVARRCVAGRRLADLWWADCEKAQRPYIRVIPRATWATVELDMLPSGRKLSKGGGELVRAALLRVWEQLPTRHRSWLVYGNCSAIPSVPIDGAETLAAELAEIVRVDLATNEWLAEVADIVARSWPA